MSDRASITGTAFTDNMATAQGWCVLIDSVMRCPASFGGAIFGFDINITDSALVDNSVGCSNDFGTTCTTSGGGVYHAGSLVLNASSCTQNTVLCDSSLGCSRGVGGCLHAPGA